jgi:hypothetical protein
MRTGITKRTSIYRSSVGPRWFLSAADGLADFSRAFWPAKGNCAPRKRAPVNVREAAIGLARGTETDGL